jgi:hypothetical protein
MSNSSPAPAAQTPDLNEDQREQLSILTSVLGTVYHFFGSFADLFSPVDDPRTPELIIYPLDALLFTGVLMFLCRLGARRQVTHMLRGNGASAAKFQALFGTALAPHGDTLNAAYRRLDPAQVQAVIIGMVKTLIRRKVLYRYRLRDRYFVIAVDGTGRLVFSERHCAHCLTATHQGRTIYYHPVLEAKLVLANGGWWPHLRLFHPDRVHREPGRISGQAGLRAQSLLSAGCPAERGLPALAHLPEPGFPLIEQGSLFRKPFPAGVGSAKNIAFRLLEAWRNLRVSADQMLSLQDARFQIRFAPP